MSDSDTPNANSDTTDTERLREIAASIMIHLEDANEAAIRAQAPGLEREEVDQAFGEIERYVNEVQALLLLDT